MTETVLISSTSLMALPLALLLSYRPLSILRLQSHNTAVLIVFCFFTNLILKDKRRVVHCPEESRLMVMQKGALSAGRCHSQGPIVSMETLRLFCGKVKLCYN